ncbi:hypothetical protein Pmani_022985 [Petrolisthes manimaculis]|uniref:Uncharacterized protein n=1 Tax=Petrolisthes manimaculis TaxID=1843537 RepID=A0AAE1PAW6_9EUCA|nr:hypothetical protein Pmani_022985 [Petrolisthes manimaculis]
MWTTLVTSCNSGERVTRPWLYIKEGVQASVQALRTRERKQQVPSLAASHRFHISTLSLMAARTLYLCLLLCLSLVFCRESAFSSPQLYKDMQRPHVVNPPWLPCPNKCEVRVGRDCKWDYKKCGGPSPRPDTGGLAKVEEKRGFYTGTSSFRPWVTV